MSERVSEECKNSLWSIQVGIIIKKYEKVETRASKSARRDVSNV